MDSLPCPYCGTVDFTSDDECLAIWDASGPHVSAVVELVAVNGVRLSVHAGRLGGFVWTAEVFRNTGSGDFRSRGIRHTREAARVAAVRAGCHIAALVELEEVGLTQ